MESENIVVAEERLNESCRNCKWYEDFLGVCFNGDSEWCADTPICPEVGCKAWGKKEEDNNESVSM